MSYPTYNMYVVSGSVAVLNGPGQLSGLLLLSPSFRQTHKLILYHSSGLLVQKTFLEFLFNLEINQQWGSWTEVGGGTPFYGQKKMIKFV